MDLKETGWKGLKWIFLDRKRTSGRLLSQDNFEILLELPTTWAI
jgi:hypothetical protein